MKPIRPEFLVATLSELAADDAMFFIDTGTACMRGSRHIRGGHNRQTQRPPGLIDFVPGRGRSRPAPTDAADAAAPTHAGSTYGRNDGFPCLPAHSG
jgi:hypothetical protein